MSSIFHWSTGWKPASYNARYSRDANKLWHLWGFKTKSLHSYANFACWKIGIPIFCVESWMLQEKTKKMKAGYCRKKIKQKKAYNSMDAQTITGMQNHTFHYCSKIWFWLCNCMVEINLSHGFNFWGDHMV